MFKSLKLGYVWLTVLIFYGLLWILDSSKAMEPLGNLKEFGLQIASKIPVLKSKIKPSTGATSPGSVATDASETLKVSLSVQQQKNLQTFLSSSNSVLKAKRSAYSQPASYYIEVDINKGTCKPKYTKEFDGFWKTPAEILCPQINKILGRPTGKETPMSDSCLLTVEEAKRQGWECKKLP